MGTICNLWVQSVRGHPQKGMISLREQFLVREMESEGAAPSAGAADRHELAGAFDNVILDLRSSIIPTPLAPMATPIVWCRLVGEHILVLGCTLAVVYIV